MRGITLEEIAEATKIGTRSLRALEDQDFDKLPGGIFNKGFVRAYSKYLGIDEDQAVADYQTAMSEAQASGKLTRPESAPPIIVDEAETPEPVRIPWGLLIVTALVVAVGFAAKSYYAQHGWAKLRRQAVPMQTAAKPAPTAAALDVRPPVAEPRAEATAAPSATGAAQKEAAAPKLNAADAASSASGAPTEFVVKVRAKEDAWIEMSADGKTVASELLKANNEKVVRAAKRVVLITGNPPGIDVLRNDTLLPSLGTERVKRTVTITAQDVRQDSAAAQTGKSAVR